MKAVQRMSNAWRRFFFRGNFVVGLDPSRHTVIFHPADSVRALHSALHPAENELP